MDGNCAFEFKTVTVALVGLVVAGIVATVTAVAVAVAVTVATVVGAGAVDAVVVVGGGFDFEVSFNSRFSQNFAVISFKFVSLTKFVLLTSTVFIEFVLKIDIFCMHLTFSSHCDLILMYVVTDIVLLCFLCHH